jgi:hypothetical protein
VLELENLETEMDNVQYINWVQKGVRQRQDLIYSKGLRSYALSVGSKHSLSTIFKYD